MRFCRRLELPYGSRVPSKRALRCHQLAEQSTRSWTSDIGLLKCHHQLLSMVSLYMLNHTDSTETRCRFNVIWPLSGGRGCIPWSISPPKSLHCCLCDDETVCTSIDEQNDHSVAVHLPKPSPVSSRVASVAKSSSVSIDASSARGNKRRLWRMP